MISQLTKTLFPFGERKEFSRSVVTFFSDHIGSVKYNVVTVDRPPVDETRKVFHETLNMKVEGVGGKLQFSDIGINGGRPYMTKRTEVPTNCDFSAPFRAGLEHHTHADKTVIVVYGLPASPYNPKG